MRRPRLATTAADGFERWTFSLKTPRFGSLYQPDETVVVPYRLHRLDETSGAVLPVALDRVVVTDRLGRQRHARDLQGEGGELCLRAEDLGNAFGAFKVTFYGEVGDSPLELGYTWFARLTGKSRPAAWCGTGVHGWGRDQLKSYDLMAAAVIGTVRNEPLWACCERQKGEYTPKPSLAAVAFMTRSLGDSAPLGEFGRDRSTYRLLGFEGRDGRRHYVGWSVETPAEVGLPASAEPLCAFDLMGNPLPWDGRGRFRLTESPVYFLPKHVRW